MRHLSAGALVDLADGTRTESSEPHLASCDRCRLQLSELREALAAAADGDVPEPSPLFWDQLSRRVGTAVAQEQANARAAAAKPVAMRFLGTRAVRAGLAAAAVLIVLVKETAVRSCGPCEARGERGIVAQGRIEKERAHRREFGRERIERLHRARQGRL